jgi:hypothetical protein
MQSLYNRAATICQDWQDRLQEIDNLKWDLLLNGYPQQFINLALKNSNEISHPKKEDKKPLGFVFIPYVKGVSEKFEWFSNQYNIKTIFKTEHISRNSLMRTTPERKLLQTVNCVYNIPCECSRSYVDETGRPFSVCIQEHRHNLREGLMKKAKLAQHAYEGHRIGWEEEEILQIETNSRYRKFKESASMACMVNPISQPSLELLAIWIPLINKEIGKKS